MKLREISLTNVRNIREAHLVADPDLTVICGENGHGKTNLLESVFLLTGSKSFRGSKDMDLVLQGEPLAKIEGKISDNIQDKTINLTLYGEGSGKKGRYASVNKVDYGRATAIAGIFTAVVFTPDHLSLIKSGPEGRRRFLDAALCQLYPGYIGTLRRFTRALSQKNALLKRFYSTQDGHMLLDAFDEELSISGTEISRKRAEYLAEAGPKAEEFYTELSQQAEQLTIRFVPCCEPGRLQQLLAASRETDLRAGFSTKGPQREDFTTSINGRSAKSFGSQGQQRSAVLSLKLAEAARAKTISGQHPVLLLDDVLSELDEHRQSYLLQKMRDKQCIITTCEPSIFERAGGKIVRMQRGVLSG